MRLIDSDALLEKMYKYSDNEGAKMPYGDDDSLIHRDSVCFLIEEAPTINPEPHWIPCSERLPERKNQTYWICTDCGYQCEARWTNDRFGLGHVGCWGWHFLDYPQYTKVVAWMPLPEPYKEVTE